MINRKNEIKDLQFKIKMAVQSKKLSIVSYNQQIKEKKTKIAELRRRKK